MKSLFKNGQPPLVQVGKQMRSSLWKTESQTCIDFKNYARRLKLVKLWASVTSRHYLPQLKSIPCWRHFIAPRCHSSVAALFTGELESYGEHESRATGWL